MAADIRATPFCVNDEARHPPCLPQLSCGSRDSTLLRQGSSFNATYELRSLMGRGCSACVYRAKLQSNNGRDVAVKFARQAQFQQWGHSMQQVQWGKVVRMCTSAATRTLVFPPAFD